MHSVDLKYDFPAFSRSVLAISASRADFEGVELVGQTSLGMLTDERGKEKKGDQIYPRRYQNPSAHLQTLCLKASLPRGFACEAELADLYVQQALFENDLLSDVPAGLELAPRSP